MKKIAGLDEKMLDMCGVNDKPGAMPTRRDVLRTFGNFKADTGDDARRTRRIISKLRDKEEPDLTLENEDMAYIEKVFEKNAMDLPAWIQGQVLELIDSAEKVNAGTAD